MDRTRREGAAACRERHEGPKPERAPSHGPARPIARSDARLHVGFAKTVHVPTTAPDARSPRPDALRRERFGVSTLDWAPGGGSTGASPGRAAKCGGRVVICLAVHRSCTGTTLRLG